MIPAKGELGDVRGANVTYSVWVGAGGSIEGMEGDGILAV
jgi:hypothetical protein